MKPDYTYKGHLIKILSDTCPKCGRQLKQLDDFEVAFCDCGQYARKIDGPVMINGNQLQFDF